MINQSIVLALCGALLTAISLVHTSFILKRYEKLLPVVAVFFTYVVASIALCVVVNFTILQRELAEPGVMGNLVMASILLCVSRLLYTHAYKHIDAGYVTIFSGFTPVLTILTAWLLLEELPSSNQLLGIGFVVVSTLVLFWRPIQLHPSSHYAYLAAFLSTIPAAFSVVLQKKVLVFMSPLHLTFSSFLLIALFSALVLLLTNASKFRVQLKRGMQFSAHWLYIGALSAGAHICFFYVVSENYTAAAQATQRSAIIFQVLLAYVLLKEKKDLTAKLLAGGIAILSMVLLLG